LQTYAEVSDWLARKGFTLIDDSLNRLTITVSGTRRELKRLSMFASMTTARAIARFYSNDRDPRLPANIAAHVQAVIGLNNMRSQCMSERPKWFCRRSTTRRATWPSCWYSAQLLEVGKHHARSLFGGLSGYFCMAEQLNMLQSACFQPTPPVRR
jgi:hypothetical protein